MLRILRPGFFLQNKDLDKNGRSGSGVKNTRLDIIIILTFIVTEYD
jgi:hypothetical protein